jgi:hypothetical protein
MRGSESGMYDKTHSVFVLWRLQVPPCEQRTSSGGGRPVAVGPI